MHNFLLPCVICFRFYFGCINIYLLLINIYLATVTHKDDNDLTVTHKDDDDDDNEDDDDDLFGVRLD